MPEKQILIPNISCSHCVRAVKQELESLAGVVAVHGDPQTKLVTVRWSDPATWEIIAGVLEEMGYPVQQ